MGLEWINEIVINIKKKYLSNSPYEICRSINIKIEKVPHNFYLLTGKKSIYFKDFYGEQIIFIRDDLYGHEEEFTLSHELGHVILHPDVHCSAHINTGKLERQADYFALTLKEIRFDKIEMNGMTLQQIASCSKVPYETLYQLVKL